MFVSWPRQQQAGHCVRTRVCKPRTFCFVPPVVRVSCDGSSPRCRLLLEAMAKVTAPIDAAAAGTAKPGDRTEAVTGTCASDRLTAGRVTTS